MVSRWRSLLTAVVLLAVVLFALGAGCSNHTAPSAIASPVLPMFDKARAWGDLERQVAFGFRVPGTDAHRATRDWLVEQLRPVASEVTLQPFSKVLGGKTVQMWNILATIPGTGAAPRERVLLAAHWDTRPTADYDPDPALRASPIAGASGVAVLLEVARQLQAHPIARDVQIALFDGEDYGPSIDNMLLGSTYYAAHLPAQKPTWGVLLDMVGDKDLGIYREPNSERDAKAVNDRLFRAARELSYLRTGTLPGFIDALYKYPITDDHTPINKAGIPMADLIDFDYPSWHTTADTVDKCSGESLKVVGDVVLYALQLP